VRKQALHPSRDNLTLNSKMKHSILCVDDEVDNVEALERLFRRQYRVLTATSGEEALKILAQNQAANQISVIISDQRMPHMSGVEFLGESIQTHPSAIRILLTGYTDIESVISAINSGQIYRYVTKPWDPVDLANAVAKAVERYEVGELLREKNLALSRALDELKTLDQAKNEFMILINHELKTPLTSVLSFGDLLAETELDTDQKRYLARVRSSALRLQDMIQDTLEFVSAQTGVTPLHIQSVAAAQIMTVPDSLQSLIESRELSIDSEIEKQKLKADEKLIRNVTRRLLHNAVKFAEKGSQIKVTGLSVNQHTYEICIRNSGPSLKEEQIRRLLKPFTLNENALHHSTGTGMGLSICQALLALHQSELNISSKDDEFQICFRLPKA
jgi:two-component system sensor histidine kinase/response regulator